MSPRDRLPLVCAGLMICCSAAVAAPSTTEPQLRIGTSTSQIREGEEFEVEIRASTPTIYGADVRLAFDPDLVEVVDSDPRTAGVQVGPGGFLPASRAFVLRNQADNREGAVNYALTLLYPAPPVAGEGTVAAVTLRAKRAGTAGIRLTQGRFGTQEGKVIVPRIDDRPTEIRIGRRRGSALSWATGLVTTANLARGGGAGRASTPPWMALLAMALIAAVTWALIARRRRS